MRGPNSVAPYLSDEVNPEDQVVRFRWLRAPATTEVDPSGEWSAGGAQGRLETIRTLTLGSLLNGSAEEAPLYRSGQRTDER